MAAPGHYPLQSQASAPANYASLQMPAQPPPQQQQMMSPTKEINAALFCRAGQECVHDIVQKSIDLFGLCRNLPLLGVNVNTQAYQDRSQRIQEMLKTILVTFQKLRVIYEKVSEISAQVEIPPEEQLIPFVGSEVDPASLTMSMNNDVYRYVAEEHREMVEQVRIKNQELKVIIDQIRTIIWEINTMITMRKT